MPFNPDHALLVVADSWDRLRGCDVDRLIVDEAGKTNTEIMPDGSSYRSRYAFRVF